MKIYKDPKTDLEWLVKDFGLMSWGEANKLHIKEFKLPSMYQLQTLINYECIWPACAKPLNLQLDNYWSSTSSELDDKLAWYVYFGDGDTNRAFKVSNYRVCLVRSIKA